MNRFGKKLLILILLIVIITAALLGYFFYQSKETKVNSLFRLVPVDASIIFESDDVLSSISLLRSQNLVWKALASSEEVHRVDTQLCRIDTLIKKNLHLFPLGKCNAVVSLHLTGKEETGILYLLQTSSPVAPDIVNEMIESETGEKGCVIEQKYEDIALYQVVTTTPGVATGLQYAIIGDVLMFSYSTIVIEDAIRQFHSPYCILDDNEFLKVQKTAGEKVNGHLYINFREFPRFISQFLDKKHKRNVISFINFASWGEFDIHIKPDQILFNGFIHSNDSVGDYLPCIVEQSPSEMEFSGVLPASTGTFAALCITDYTQWRKSLGLFYEKEGSYSEFREPIDKLKKDYKVDIEEVTAAIFDKEAVLVYNSDNNNSFDDNHFVYVKVKSRDQARTEMLKILSAKTKLGIDSLEKYIHTASIDKDFAEEIIEMPVPYLARMMFGNLFSRVETRYLTFIGNYMVFGNSISSLRNLQYTILLKKDLASEKSFRSVCEDLSKKSNFIVYTDPQRSSEFLGWYADKTLMTHLQEQKDNYKNICSVTLQLTSSKEMLYTNFIITYSQKSREQAKTVWESRLDTTFSSKPWLVVNHNTDEKEILLQDDKNQLYLINASGRIEWKIALSERIMSDVTQIDAFKNSKLQYIFNTKNYLIMVDRNGNFIDRFPMKFRAEATNGIAVFDYEKNRDYRVFVACNDKRIYCYKADGSLVSGFEFEKADNIIYQPLQHFRFGDKDFIVFCDTLKTYILDRKGKTRVKISEFIPTNRNSRFFAETSERNNEKFIFSDINGQVVFVDLKGKVIRLKLEEFSSSHFFEYYDINGDGKGEFCFFDNNIFSAFTTKKVKLFDMKLPEPALFKPAFYIFPNNSRKAGFTCSNTIYLSDSKGNIHPGFPLIGSTPFSIGKLSPDAGTFNLITGGQEGILLNYEVMY